MVVNVQGADSVKISEMFVDEVELMIDIKSVDGISLSSSRTGRVSIPMSSDCHS